MSNPAHPLLSPEAIRSARAKYIAVLAKRYGDHLARRILLDARFLGAVNALCARDLEDGAPVDQRTEARTRRFATLVGTFITGSQGSHLRFATPLQRELQRIEFAAIAA